VKTKYAIKPGEFILEYVGEVVSEKEFKARMATLYIHDTHHYCLNLDGGLVIDGHRMGGDGEWDTYTQLQRAGKVFVNQLLCVAVAADIMFKLPVMLFH
jgi:hypothetical protein